LDCLTCPGATPTATGTATPTTTPDGTSTPSATPTPTRTVTPSPTVPTATPTATGTAPPQTSLDVTFGGIAQAAQQGLITGEEGALYRLYAVFGDPRLPGQFAPPPSAPRPPFGTLYLLEALNATSQLPPDARERVMAEHQAMGQRVPTITTSATPTVTLTPTSAASPLPTATSTATATPVRTGFSPRTGPSSPPAASQEAAGRFALLSREGPLSLLGQPPALLQPLGQYSECSNDQAGAILARRIRVTYPDLGHRAFATRVCNAIETAWDDQIGSSGLGFAVPKSPGGDPRYWVIIDPGLPVGAFTDPSEGGFSVIHISTGICGGLQSVDQVCFRDYAEHELHHASQFTYSTNVFRITNDVNSYWLIESSAVWMQRRFQPNSSSGIAWWTTVQGYLNNVAQGLTSFPPSPEFEDRAGAYGSVLFLIYLTDRAGENLILRTWQGLPSESTTTAALNTALGNMLSQHFDDFAVQLWQYYPAAKIVPFAPDVRLNVLLKQDRQLPNNAPGFNLPATSDGAPAPLGRLGARYWDINTTGLAPEAVAAGVKLQLKANLAGS